MDHIPVSLRGNKSDRTRTLQFDTQQTVDFLGVLNGGPSRNEEFTFQTIDDNKQRDDKGLARTLRGRFSDTRDELKRLNQLGAGVYVTVNRTRPGRRIKENVVAVRALFIDLDGAPLDPLWTWKLAPHIVVESSRGKFHVYWLVDETVKLEHFGALQRKLATVFNSDTNVSALPRVLRLPCLWHQKVAKDGRRSDPFMTRMIHPSEAGPVDW